MNLGELVELYGKLNAAQKCALVLALQLLNATIDGGKR